MDIQLAEKLDLPLSPLELPIPASALNNQIIAYITHQTAPVRLVTSGNHNEQTKFFIFPSPDMPLILGYPWLQTHNPQIDWAGKRISNWSLFCLANCLRSAVPSTCARPASPVVAPPDLSSVPAVYHDLQEVFHKDKACSLPPHRPYDCAIDLLPGAPLPSSRLYNLSRPERESMERYIQESLTAGII